MNVKQDAFLIEGGKSAVMMMIRRSLADRSKLELRRQPGRHGCQQ